MMSSRRTLRIGILAIFLTSYPVIAFDNIDRYLQCYRAVADSTAFLGRNASIAYRGIGRNPPSWVFAPATRHNRSGFYIFTNNVAYFYPLPNAVQTSQGLQYRFRLYIPGSREPYFFRYRPGIPIDITIARGESQFREFWPDLQLADIPIIEGSDALDDSSRSVLRAEIQSRLSNVPDVVPNSRATDSGDWRSRPDSVARRLGPCVNLGDSEIRRLARDMQTRLPSTRANTPPPVSTSEGASAH